MESHSEGSGSQLPAHGRLHFFFICWATGHSSVPDFCGWRGCCRSIVSCVSTIACTQHVRDPKAPVQYRDIHIDCELVLLACPGTASHAAACAISMREIAKRSSRRASMTDVLFTLDSTSVVGIQIPRVFLLLRQKWLLCRRCDMLVPCCWGLNWKEVASR